MFRMEDNDEAPVRVYEGLYTEIVFLKTLLEGSGINTSRPTRAGAIHRGTHCLFVSARDLKRAVELVEHFRQHGKKTD
jgi:hypothetical protein